MIGYNKDAARRKTGRYHKGYGGTNMASCGWMLLDKRFRDDDEEMLANEVPQLARCQHVSCWGKGQAEGEDR